MKIAISFHFSLICGVTTSGKACVLCIVFLLVRQADAAAVSARSFRMSGELVWNYGTNTIRIPTVVNRDGDVIKLSQVTQPDETNYSESVYLSTPRVAVSFYQYSKDLASEKPANGPWNNGQVSISNHRIPESASLVPIWLMLNAAEILPAAKNKLRPSLFSEGRGIRLLEHPRVTAEATVTRQWPAGFATYSETFTNSESGKISHTTFAIESWTNFNGVNFPKSCAGTCSDWDIRYHFVATHIEELTRPIDQRVPVRSAVTDWRPLEEARTPAGCFYEITNGLVFDDIVREAEKGKVHHGSALTWSQSHPMPEGTVAADFAITDLSGKKFTLSEFRGRYVLLNFWSTTCVPCLQEIPSLNEAHEAYGGKVVMLGLALDDSERAVKNTIQKYGMKWRQAILKEEFDSEVTRKYKVKAIPATYLIGPDGKIAGQPGGDFKQALANVLNKITR
jgi:thiol-disulfide isomerase/thioredoxin